MTREEAIKHFESQAQCNYRPFSEAAKMAVSALRAQQEPVKLDRSRWEGCVVCNGCGVGGSNELLCGGVEAKYCPLCGRPLTEKAWAGLERRINDGKTDL